jgi:hypothetical protein
MMEESLTASLKFALETPGRKPAISAGKDLSPTGRDPSRDSRSLGSRVESDSLLPTDSLVENLALGDFDFAALCRRPERYVNLAVGADAGDIRLEDVADRLRLTTPRLAEILELKMSMNKYRVSVCQ